jgi:hypothetical protein
MKFVAIVLGGLAVTSLAVSPLWADNTDAQNVGVNGTILAPVQITVTQPMIMPHLVARHAADPNPFTNVRLTCNATSDASNVVTYQRNGNPFADGNASAPFPAAGSANRTSIGLPSTASTGQCAQLTINGQPNYYVTTTRSNPVATSGAGFGFLNNDCKTTGNVNLGNPGSARLDGSGALTVRCGMETRAFLGASSTYTATFNFTVTYD